MKKNFLAAITAIICICCIAFSAQAFELAKMTKTELLDLISQIDAEIEKSHATQSDISSKMLDSTKRFVESYLQKDSSDVAWPWFDYTYSRAWNLYTLNTRISYQDGNEKRSPDVYAEAYIGKEPIELIYFKLGNEVILDHRKDYEQVLRAAADADGLSAMNRESLDALKKQAKAEINNNHSTDYSQEKAVLDITKAYVEDYYHKKSIAVSWPWFDYSYTREWNLFTLKTNLSYKDGKEKRNPDVYAEVILSEDAYKLIYLKVGNDEFLDIRSDYISTDAATAAASKTAPPDAQTDLASADKVNKATALVTPSATPNALPTPTVTPAATHIAKGSKGEAVRVIQLRLIQLGYLKGSSSGTFDSKTQAAVKAFQKANKLKATGEIGDADLAKLVEMSREFAKRAAVVAITNRQAVDVFKKDGNTYDKTKFHRYADVHNGYLAVYDEGSWTQIEDAAWHVEGLILRFEQYEQYIKAFMDVRFDGKNYVISGGGLVIAGLAYLDSNDPAKTSGVETLKPSKNAPYLTVSPDFVKKDRDLVKEAARRKELDKKAQMEEERRKWFTNQLSIWDGSHKAFEKLIKKKLNDEKSYKHIETNYYDISSQEMLKLVNGVLADAKLKQKVKIGDFLIVTEFSAKNAFNATIKSVAFGIVSYENKTIKLIGIE